MADDYELRQQTPSKSQLKRDAQARQQLGVALLAIPEQDWLRLGLPEVLVTALRDARQTPSRGAHKRQLQLIGKLMRDIDPEPIQRRLEQLRLSTRQEAQRQRACEDWRDRMIVQGDSAIDAYLNDHPAADRQHLRQLVRQAKKEQTANKPPRFSRALFRYLRDVG